MRRESRKIAAILAADVVEYSRWMAVDEPGTLAALKSLRASFSGQVAEFGGREFGSVGDSLMAEFASAVDAVACALAVQARLAGEASDGAGPRLRLRIGVNLGDVIQDGDALFGDAVNVAARLQGLARPGGVLVSGSVHDQVRLKLPARFVAAGTRRVHNIPEPVRTFDVRPLPAGPAGRIAAAAGRFFSRRVVRASAAGAGVAVLLALALFWRDIPVPATGARLGEIVGVAGAPPNSIAVLPFLNLSGDPRFDYLGDGLAEELGSRLARVRELSVSSRTSAFAFKGESLGVRDIARELGVAYVVEGSVRRQADRIRVVASLVESRTGESRWSDIWERPAEELREVEADLLAQVVAELRRALGLDGDAPPPGPPRGGFAAYDLYLQGLAYLRQPPSTRSLAAAEELFTRALERDPKLARAQAGLCEARVERFQLERDPAHVAAAGAACAKATSLDAAAQEVHLAVGKLRLATGDDAEAVAAYRRAEALAPNSPDVLIGLANALASAGERDEAERIYRRAIAAQPRYAAAHMAYGDFLFSPARAVEAAAAYEQATILTPDDPTAFSNLGASRLLTGDFEGARAAFARSLELDPRDYAYANLGSVEYYLGHYARAEALYRKAAGLAPSNHRPWGNLADALRFAGRPDEAARAYRRALALVGDELAVNPTDPVNLAQAAYYASQLGERERARQHLAAALADTHGDYAYVHYYAALTELAFGDTAAAEAHVKRSRELGYPEALLRNAPELGGLGKND